MELVALRPLSLGTLRWRTEAGANNLTIIVKATFELRHEGLAELTVPYPLFDDVHFEENEGRSLRAASDFAVKKPRADIIFTGGIYAPLGERTPRQEARLAVGTVSPSKGELAIIDKRILAVGSRDKDPRSPTGETTPSPFGHLPLRYELAYGGASSKSNPIGVGADAEDPRLPNILHPQNPKLVAGFGAVPRSWWWRKRSLAGSDAETWLTQDPMVVPAAIDLAFFNSAPPDQQVAYLRGDEWISLRALHPTYPHIRSKLPGLSAHAKLGEKDLKLVLDTLWIDGDTLRATLTWRAVQPIESAQAEAQLASAKLLVTLAPEGEAPIWAAAAPPPRAPTAPLAPPSPPTAPKAKKDFAETTLDLELERPVASSQAKPKLPPPPRISPYIPVLNSTKLPAFTIPWQVKPPQDALVVVVKATFTIGDDGSLKLADEQDLPNGDAYYDEEEEGDTSGHVSGDVSLRYPSDFALFKPAADVLLVGHAHAPKRKAKDMGSFEEGVAHVDFRLGNLRRRLAVFGERRWGSTGIEGKPLAFEKLPLRYERAMGGPLSELNPVGRGFKTGILLPNLENPEALVKLPDDRPPPACFGPIAPLWRPRRAKLGTYDPKWLKARWPYLPQDFDWSYFNAAPKEQQVPYLRGDERFFLAGLHPDKDTIEGKLPDMRPRVYAQKTREAGGDFFEVTLRLDTAWFDTDAMKLVLVWRGIFSTTDEDAPELSWLFVAEDTVKAPLKLDKAQERFFAELATRVPVPPEFLRFADEPSREETNGVSAPAPPPPLTRAAAVALLAASTAALAGRDLTRADLSGIDLTKADLSGATLHRANLGGAQLSGANLEGAVLTRVIAGGASFAGANLTKADLSGATLRDADLTGATLAGATLERCNAEGARFTGAAAKGAAFGGAKLTRASFERAVLAGADLSFANVDGANFKGANLDQARFYDATGEGATFDGGTMRGARSEGARFAKGSFVGVEATGSGWEAADLTGATFHGAKLEGAVFFRARLDGALLSQCLAKEAQFRRASMKGARLIRANLMQATFERADLSGADLRGANLYQSETWKAKLDAADLSAANLAGTKLAKQGSARPPDA